MDHHSRSTQSCLSRKNIDIITKLGFLVLDVENNREKNQGQEPGRNSLEELEDTYRFQAHALHQNNI